MVAYNLPYTKPKGEGVLICTLCVMDTHSLPSSRRLSHPHPDLQFASMTSRLPPLPPSATHSPPLPPLPPMPPHSPPLPPLPPLANHSPPLPLATIPLPPLPPATNHLPSLRLVTASIPPFQPRPHPLLGGKPQRRPTSFHTATNGKFPYFSFFAYRS